MVEKNGFVVTKYREHKGTYVFGSFTRSVENEQDVYEALDAAWEVLKDAPMNSTVWVHNIIIKKLRQTLWFSYMSEFFVSPEYLAGGEAKKEIRNVHVDTSAVSKVQEILQKVEAGAKKKLKRAHEGDEIEIEGFSCRRTKEGITIKRGELFVGYVR